MAKKWKGYAIKVSGYGGEKYALFKKGLRTGTSSLASPRLSGVANGEKHKAELRASGYKVRKGYVRE